MKSNRLRKILMGVASLIVCLMALCVVLVNTSAFRDYLRSEISKKAFEITGARVEMASLEIHWRELGLVIDGISVYGTTTGAEGGPTLLAAQQLEVGVRFLPLLRGRVELSKLILDRPAMHIRIDSQGQSNLPTPPQVPTSPGIGPVFDLKVGRCVVRGGELYYNDAQIPLDAQLHDLQFESTYRMVAGEYAGSFSYSHGTVTGPGIASLPHSLQMKFIASRTNFRVDPLIVSSGNSQIHLNAKLTNFERPTVEGIYDAKIATAELANTLQEPSLPAGIVVLRGKIRYWTPVHQPNAEKSSLAPLFLEGTAECDRLLSQFRGKVVTLDSASADYSIHDATLQIRNVAADFIGGRVGGDFEIMHLDSPNYRATFNGFAKDLALANVNAFASQNARRIPVVGRASLELHGGWQGSLRNTNARARIEFSSNRKSLSAENIPIDGIIEVAYDGRQNLIAFGPSHLESDSTQLNVNGSLGSAKNGAAALVITATTADLREVQLLATILQKAVQPTKQQPTIPPLSGSARVTAHITGTLATPHVEANISGRDFSVGRSRWRSLTVDVSAAPSELRFENGTASGMGSTLLTFGGKAGLHDWALEPSSPVSAQATIENMTVATAQEFIQVHYPVSGTVSAKLSLSGTRQTPDGKLTLHLTKASAWDEPIDKITVDADSHGGVIKSKVEMQIPAGTIQTDLNYALAAQHFDFNFKGRGIRLERIPGLQMKSAVEGTADLWAAGNGEISNPHLELNLAIPQLRTLGQSISNISASVKVENRRAALDLNSVFETGKVHATGEVALAGSHYTTAALDVQELPISALTAAFLPALASKVGGYTEIHARLKGPLEFPAQLEGHLEIPSLRVTFGKAQIALAQPLEADYRDGSVTLTKARITGTGTTLSLGGTFPIHGNAPFSYTADGKMDLGVLSQFASDIRSSGQVEIHVHSAERTGQPNLQGQLQINNAVFSSETSPVGIEGLSARINLSGTHADIVDFSGTAGGGKISATGSVDFGRQKNFDVHLDAQSVRIRYPEGLRSILSGQLSLEGSPDHSALTGRAMVNSISFTQEFDLAKFVSTLADDSGSTAASSFEKNVSIRVSVESSQDINLASSKLSIGGSANLNLTGTLAQPVLLGRIGLKSGEIFFLGKRFELQNGTIQFANPARTDPTLSMYVTTKVEQYNVTLNLNGPIERLRTSYTSEPALPPADIIHLLAFGNTSEEAAASPSQSAAMGAESVLAQGVTSQIAGKVENVTGISQLTIDPLATSSQGNSGAQIAIQQRVTGSLLLTFSTNVTSTQAQTVQLQYDLSKRVSVTILRDQNGGYGIDLRIHKAF